jgi:transcriptional regulator with XRE-family HTH domain
VAASREVRAVLVKKALERSGLSRAQLARDSEISESALWSWIKGKRVPDADSLRRLAEGLELRSKELQDLAEELRKAARD